MTISESSTQIYCRQPINFASCSSPRPNLMDLMGKNFQYIKHPKNVYAKFHTYLFVEFLCHINGYFKVLFQLILLVAQYKYDRHFMSHLVIKSKVHYATKVYFLKEFNINIKIKPFLHEITENYMVLVLQDPQWILSFFLLLSKFLGNNCT